MKSNREVKERKMRKIKFFDPFTGEEITGEKAAELAELTGQAVTKQNYRLEDLPMDIIQKLPQVNEIAQKAASGGATNERLHWQRKLKGLRAKISKLDKSFHEGIGAESMRFDVLLLVDELLEVEKAN